jgi:putative restriction endonuclease
MFAHLDRLTAQHPEGIPSHLINDFVYAGQHLRLIVQPGIWKPRHLDAALTIRTTFAGSPTDRPYEDEIGPDRLLRYKWRGTDPGHADNRALRNAMGRGLPLAYFVGVARGVYQAIHPVFVVEEEPALNQFVVGIDEQRADTRAGWTPTRGGPALRRAPAEVAVAPAGLPGAGAPGVRLIVCDVSASAIRPGGRGPHSRRHTSAWGACRAQRVGIVQDPPCRVRREHSRYPSGSRDRNESGHPRADRRSDASARVARHARRPAAVPRQRSAHPDADRLEERYEVFRAA